MIRSIGDRLPQVPRTVLLPHHVSASQPPLPLHDQSYARRVSRSRRYHVEGPAMAPIDLAHDSISCTSLPLYLWNLFADRDRPGIGVLTDAGVPPPTARGCAVRSRQLRYSPIPNRPTPTRTTYLGSELLGSSTLWDNIGGVKVYIPFYDVWRHWCLIKAQITRSS